MFLVKRTDSSNPEFIALVKKLDADLAQRDGEDHSFYSQFNSIENLNQAVLVYDEDELAGCGAMKAFDDNSMEIKRMYTLPAKRGKGIASKVLYELENWARELSYSRCVLETGKRQPEAIALYKKHNYTPIPNYGQYRGIQNSCCFEKILNR